MRLRRRFQATSHLSRSLLPTHLFEAFEEHFEEPQLKQEGVMVENDIVGIANYIARNIRDYVVFDPNTMNMRILQPEITVAHFEFSSMMFQMLQVIGQYSNDAIKNPYLYLRKFLEVSSFKILGITDDAFILKFFPYSLRDISKGWLNSL